MTSSRPAWQSILEHQTSFDGKQSKTPSPRNPLVRTKMRYEISRDKCTEAHRTQSAIFPVSGPRITQIRHPRTERIVQHRGRPVQSFHFIILLMFVMFSKHESDSLWYHPSNESTSTKNNFEHHHESLDPKWFTSRNLSGVTGPPPTYDLYFGCRNRKRAHSRWATMLLARFLLTCDVLKTDLHDMEHESREGKKIQACGRG